MKWLKKILGRVKEPAEDPVVEETREQQLDKAFEELKRKIEEEGLLKQAREEQAQRTTRKSRTETNQEIIQRVVMSKRRPASQRPTVPINYGTAKVGSKEPFFYEIKELEEMDETQAKVKAEVERDMISHMMAQKVEMMAKHQEAMKEAARIEAEQRKAEEAQRAENPDWGGFS